MPSSETTARQYAVVTNCTGRKLHKGARTSLTISMAAASTAELAAKWVSALAHAEPAGEAQAFYAGRSFQDARAAAQQLNSPLWIVSAGLGLVHFKEQVPAYDLTVGPGTNSVTPLVKASGDQLGDWWRALASLRNQTPTPLADLLSKHRNAILLLALPTTYLALVANELAGLRPAEAKRLRIFTSYSWARTAPPALLPALMPYDERLESTALAGTRHDFPQRALLHFVTALKAQLLDQGPAADAVRQAMASLQLRVRPMREKRSDHQIRDELRRQWHTYSGEGAKLLRYLRDDALIQCEQTRFKHLWHEVRQEFKAKAQP
jgi:hypothetical protein